MSDTSALFVVLAGMGVLAVMTAPAEALGHNPLGDHLSRDRVLILSAPRETDPLVDVQRHSFTAMRWGARDRDLVLVEAIGSSPEAMRLRQAFAIESQAFEAVLVGKDGGVKLRSAIPLGPDRLFPVIDAMPMRREEMSRTGQPQRR